MDVYDLDDLTAELGTDVSKDEENLEVPDGFAALAVELFTKPVSGRFDDKTAVVLGEAILREQARNELIDSLVFPSPAP